MFTVSWHYQLSRNKSWKAKTATLTIFCWIILKMLNMLFWSPKSGLLLLRQCQVLVESKTVDQGTNHGLQATVTLMDKLFGRTKYVVFWCLLVGCFVVLWTTINKQSTTYLFPAEIIGDFWWHLDKVCLFWFDPMWVIATRNLQNSKDHNHVEATNSKSHHILYIYVIIIIIIIIIIFFVNMCIYIYVQIDNDWYIYKVYHSFYCNVRYNAMARSSASPPQHLRWAAAFHHWPLENPPNRTPRIDPWWASEQQELPFFWNREVLTLKNTLYLKR